jgi:competence protein ComEA
MVEWLGSGVKDEQMTTSHSDVVHSTNRKRKTCHHTDIDTCREAQGVACFNGNMGKVESEAFSVRVTGFTNRGFIMSIKTLFSALALAAVASTAVYAQTAQQPAQPTNPLRQTVPAAPAAPAAPAVQRPATPAAPTAATPPAQQRAATVPANQLVNLNTATASELDKLPQIGDARAKAIIAGRPYSSWADFAGRNIIPKNAEDAINGKVKFR